MQQNAAMPTIDEKKAFSKRLEFALRRSPDRVQGATELALRFNLRYRGNAVSVQTAHKWLTARAIPTNDKLATLAKWLNVSEHWLHYGPPPSRPLELNQKRAAYKTQSEGKTTASSKEKGAKALLKPTNEALILAIKIQALTSHRRYIVEALVEQLQDDVT